MSAYREKWVEILKNQQKPNWNIDIHGQAIVINVPSDEDPKVIEKQIPGILDKLRTEVKLPAEWLKFIFYNEKSRFEYILNPELRILK